MSLARKNNNPLNLRPLPGEEKWRGQVGVDVNPTSGSFCVFKDNAHGVRAAVKNLQAYVRTGTRTLRDAIYRWAPPAGDKDGDGRADYTNHTDNYLAHVTKVARVPSSWDISWIVAGFYDNASIDELARIVMAMNQFESGERDGTASAEDVWSGIAMALDRPPGTRTVDGGNTMIVDVEQSKIVKDAKKADAITVAKDAAAVAGMVATPLLGLDWKVAAVLAAALLAGTVVVLVFGRRIRKWRREMFKDGVA